MYSHSGDRHISVVRGQPGLQSSRATETPGGDEMFKISGFAHRREGKALKEIIAR